MYDILLPFRKLKRKVNILWNFLYDYRRIVTYSSAVSRGDNRGKLQALIMMRYHGIEKALSLPNPRENFGKEKVSLLLDMLEKYVAKYGLDYTTEISSSVLYAYKKFNESGIGPELNKRIDRFRATVGDYASYSQKGGVKTISKADLMQKTNINFEEFCSLRHSVRQFSEQPVDLNLIKQAVIISQKTPSVCNRQSSKVWIIRTPEKKDKALEIGNGAKGFGEKIGLVLVVTSDLSCFQSSGERYQCWIDGGMFSMSLLYALHSKGLVTCCMNWSKERKDDIKMKKTLGIPGSESIIMLVAVGCPLEEYVVAKSTRKQLDDVIRII